jgi:hypothetical protein
MSTPLSGQDLRAAAEVHWELGPEYSDAIVDSFLEKVEAKLDERMNARLVASGPRKRVLAKPGGAQRRGWLAEIAVGAGVAGVFVGLGNSAFGMGGNAGLGAAVLVASGGACGAGLTRIFRDRPSASQCSSECRHAPGPPQNCAGHERPGACRHACLRGTALRGLVLVADFGQGRRAALQSAWVERQLRRESAAGSGPENLACVDGCTASIPRRVGVCDIWQLWLVRKRLRHNVELHR